MGQIVRKEEAEKVKVGPSHEDLLYCNKVRTLDLRHPEALNDFLT